jgi:hypothetical protein
MVPMVAVHGWIPNLYIRFLDGVSGALLRGMRIATGCVCNASWKLFGRQEPGSMRAVFSWLSTAISGERAHGRGPMHSMLRLREEHSRRLLEEGASTLERRLIEWGIL